MFLNKKMKVSKAIIPVAGLGTRMLPATKVIPKEMLPILDKPIIQYVVEECLSAGFNEIIFVTHSSKNSIENHFDKSFELESTLEKRIKRNALDEIRSITKMSHNISSVRQSEALGLGHAVLQAKSFISDEPFAVILPDRVMNKASCDLTKDNLAQMKEKFQQTSNSIILLEKINKKDCDQYGIAELKGSKSLKPNELKEIVNLFEKPSQSVAPSNLAIVGRYIFTPEIFKYIKRSNSKTKEIELTDAINSLIKNGNKVKALIQKGECFDCGSKEGYFEAILKTALNHDSLKSDFKKIIKKINH